MAGVTNIDHPLREREEARRPSTWRNVAIYMVRRVSILALTVVAAVYLTIVIANFGGYVDTMVAARIEEQVGFLMRTDWNRDLPPDERTAAAEQLIVQMKDEAGLNDPFLLRTLGWLGDGLLLNWGQAESARGYGINTVGMTVGEIVADNLSRSVLVFGLANLILFFASIAFGLFVNRRHQGFVDKLFVILTPISAAPAWVFGILLSIFLLRVFGFSPGGTFTTFPGELQLSYVLVVLRHLLLPFLSIFIAGFFLSAYNWRSLFQVYGSEDYVDMAYAKGLSRRRIDRQYILRPTLPALLTSFALMLVALWQEIIALEYFFNVQGLGRLFVNALNRFDTPMIVAIVTTFAYLIAITVFTLDIFYVFVDPRIRVGGRQDGQGAGQLVQNKKKGRTAEKRPSPTLDGRPRRRTLSLTWPRFSAGALARRVRGAWQSGWELAANLFQYPSAIVGLLIIGGLVGISIYAVVTIPYDQVRVLWRGDDNVWARNPRNALPAWVNYFREDDLPPTFSFSSQDEGVRQVATLEGGLTEVTIPFSFDYDYGGFPQDIIVDITTQYESRGPHVVITWVRPDGSEQELTSFKPNFSDSYFVGRDTRLQRRMRTEVPLQKLFLGPDGEAEAPVAGSYTLRISALLFEPETTFEADAVVLGQVYGLAGTDANRRDLMIGLLWGTPVALSFGLVAAVAVSVGSMLIAAVGVWFGGIVDRIIQFFTELNLILPFFPVALMVFVMYSRSILVILAVTVALMLFGSSIKSFRSVLLQIRSAPYIEAAEAYGASDRRIIARYLFPKVRTLLLPKLITLVPTFVFLEATLAFLGVFDPSFPTWGNLVVAALSTGVYTGESHIVIAPLALLFLTGFGFAMLGIALERIFEPRLRQR